MLFFFFWCWNICNHFLEVWGISAVRFQLESLKAGCQHLTYGIWFTNECPVPTYLMFMTRLHKWNESIWKLYTLLHEAAKVLANCMVLCFSPFFKCEQIRFINTVTRSYHLCYAIIRLEKYINLQYKYQLHIQQDSMFFSFLHWLHGVGITTQVQFSQIYCSSVSQKVQILHPHTQK